MWEEGARIYSTPGVHNNFPMYMSMNIILKKKKIVVDIVYNKCDVNNEMK